MNFKDLQFNLGKLTTNVKSQVAKNNPLQNHDTRSLNLWLFEERNDLAYMRTSSYHHAETNKAFLEWVKEELVKNRDNDKYSQDIEDIGSALCSLLDKQVELEKQYTERYQLYRRAIKSMREKETELHDLKEKKQSITDRIQHLKKSNSHSKKLSELEKELEELNENQTKENESSTDFKRFILKEAFYLRFNALQEFSEKSALIAGFGKYLVDLLDPTTTATTATTTLEESYDTETILMDALLTVDGWEPKDQRQTLTKEDDLLLDNQSEDAVILTEHDIKLPSNTKSESLPSSSNEKKVVQDDYYDQLYKRVVLTSSQKKPISSHRSYAEFQTQFNLPTSVTAAAAAAVKDSPPAYSKNDTIVISDEKK